MGLPRLSGARRLALLAALVLSGCAAEESSLDPSLLEGPAAAPLVRPDTPGNGLLFNFEPTDVVETFGSSGGRLSQARTVISRAPNVTACPTGASMVETRAVILSSPCSLASSIGTALAGAPDARTSAAAAIPR